MRKLAYKYGQMLVPRVWVSTHRHKHSSRRVSSYQYRNFSTLWYALGLDSQCQSDSTPQPEFDVLDANPPPPVFPVDANGTEDYG